MLSRGRLNKKLRSNNYSDLREIFCAQNILVIDSPSYPDLEENLDFVNLN